MDSGWAAFLGAIVGAVATLGGLVLTDYIQARRKTEADRPKKRLLADMLRSGHKWRTLTTMANVTGLTESEVKQLLVEIGARGSETDSALWGLVSRNPLPTHDENPN